MNPDVAAPWIAIALGLGAVVFCAVALNARSLVISVLAFLAGGALIAASLLAFGNGEAALAQALIGVGLLPALLLAGLLLSARTVKPRRARRPWFAAFFALAMVCILLWALLSGGPGSARVLDHDASSIFGLAPMFLVLATACVALLGFGERGAFDHPPSERLFGERES